MSAVVRFYAVVKDGIVVASRSSVRHYPVAVVHRSPHPPYWFATFHHSRDRATESATRFFGGKGEVVDTIETDRRLQVGAPFEQATARDVAEVV